MSLGLYLIAHVGDRAIAVDTATIDSVVDIGAVVPVPGAPAGIAGLAALRSKVVTVVDPRVALGLAASDRGTARAVITSIEGHSYAVLVDALEDIASFEAAPLTHDPGATGWRGAGCAMIERAREPIMVIDLAALVPGLSAAA